MITESFDIIDNKLTKNNSMYFHYTSIENFHKIVNSLVHKKKLDNGLLVNDDGLRGSYYPANTNTYGEITPIDKKTGKTKELPNELCLVRSDKIPDNYKNLNLSGNIGDIKFNFKEDKIVEKFGKIKPIGEYPVQDKKWILKAANDCEDDIILNAPLPFTILDNIRKKFHSLTHEEMERNIKHLKRFMAHPKKADELMSNYEEYHSGRDVEHMESRIRIPKGKAITIDFIDKIMIPTYLKDDTEIKNDIVKLRENGFNNIVFYKCKYPKEDYRKDS